MPYLVIFGVEFKKIIFIFEISTLKFAISKSLNHKVNSDVVSAFSKVPGSTFSEGLGPNLGLLYRVSYIFIFCF